MPKLVAISDTHGRHRDVEVPDGDILVHAGDLTQIGDLGAVEAFDAWLAELPHPHKIVIAGNHDFALERQADAAEAKLQHATYLRDSGCEIDGLRIWGSPWTPEFFEWAFMLPRGPELAEKWAAIPEDVDVLMTHGPPHGILDATHGGKNAGCKALRERVLEVDPPVHVFGHIHEARGRRRIGGTEFINASCAGGQPAFVVEVG